MILCGSEVYILPLRYAKDITKGHKGLYRVVQVLILKGIKMVTKIIILFLKTRKIPYFISLAVNGGKSFRKYFFRFINQWRNVFIPC